MSLRRTGTLIFFFPVHRPPHSVNRKSPETPPVMLTTQKKYLKLINLKIAVGMQCMYSVVGLKTRVFWFWYVSKLLDFF